MGEIVSETIGDRTARLRARRGLTQEQLADAAGVSIDLVRKLEQNRRRSTRIGTLHALARALNVQTSVLLDAPFPQEVGRPGPRIVPLRHALTPGIQAPDVEPPSLDELRAAIGQAWTLHQRGDYESTTCVLPDLINQVRAATREHPGDAGQQLLAEVYHLAAVLLLGVRAEDLACLAAERLQVVADGVGDPSSRARAADTWAWVFCRQGRLDDAERVALTTADEIEPRFSATPDELALWSALLQRGVMVAARNDEPDRVDDLIALARATADRIGEDRNDRWSISGPTNVAMHAVRAAVDLGQPEKALELVKDVPRLGSVPPAWWARHLLDVAHAQYDVKLDAQALETFERIDRLAPGWLPYQGIVHEIVRGMLRRGRRTPELRRVAARLDLQD
jgi:transcriptional regulator with XRE-family HTH domain